MPMMMVSTKKGKVYRLRQQKACFQHLSEPISLGNVVAVEEGNVENCWKSFTLKRKNGDKSGRENESVMR